jgi:hypothetical protein
MPRFTVAVDRTAEYSVEALSASQALDIVFGDGHRVYDSEGNEIRVKEGE